ncbi:phage tail tape measure protein [Streptomyces sp. NRRL F-5527]|uniref:phage tail tape measure protein n=1 Tax=Streptomyces TaxID=1883 RepID=UPI00068CE719|nr:phage tail tape measure protein [Streptomyces sp. NRRL F-5527]
MALMVGELQALLSIDDRAVQPALRRAEQALRRSGQDMGSDAERAGQEAGTRLGEGLVRGADGRWRTMRGELADAATAAVAEAEAVMRRGGQRAGDAFADGAEDGGQQAGDALADGVGDGADQAVNQAGGKMERLKQVAGGAAMAAGAAAGALLLSAFGEALDQSAITAKLGAQLDLTGPQAQRYGKLAGHLYTSAVVDTFQEGADAIRAVAGSGLVPPDATNRQIESIAANATDLADLIGVDVGQAANAAGTMLRNGLARNGKEAFDLLVMGSKGLGTASEDLLETFSEYSPIFAEAGVSGKTAMGLIRQAIQGGWGKDTDKIADAFKELQLRVGEGKQTAVDALQAIGLNSTQVINDMRAGGARGEAAMDQISDALRRLGPTSAEAKQAVKDLFGGPGEDLGATAYKLDVDKASKAMDSAKGAADRYGDALRDNAGTKVKAFQRGMQQGVVNFLGSKVIPGLQTFGKKLSGMWDEAGKGIDGGSMAQRILAFIPLLGSQIAQKIGELAPKIIGGLVSAGEKAAEWAMANPMQLLKVVAIAGAFALALTSLPVLLASLLGAVAISILVGFVGRLIDAANSKLPQLGSAIGRWFSGLWSKYVAGPVSRVWNSFISSVSGLPGRAAAALSSLGSAISQRAAKAWQSFKDTTVQRALSMVQWVTGLPGRISRGIGSLSSLLTEKGRNVVQGLWSGISSMGGWIRSKLISWAKDMIPGPIAKALGIASPSKVTAAQGKWIAQGLVAGLTGNQKQVKAAAYKLSDIVRDALTGKKERKAIAKINKSANSLVFLAGWDAKVASQLKTAKKRVQDLQKARTDLVNSVRNGIMQDADITKQDTSGWSQTAASILAGLKQDTLAAQTFAKNLATLQKKGVRRDLISQIAQAGVSGGAASAAALANATSKEIRAINDQQAMLNGAAAQAGRTAGSAMYDAGIRAAQGLVKGLTSHQRYIESTMLRIAKSMSKSIRKALGIKSPSRVMAQVGAYTAQGLVAGMEGERSAVNRTMASLVDTPAPGGAAVGGGYGYGGRQKPVQVQLVVSGSRREDLVLTEMIRRRVRIGGGGDVQAYFGQTKSVTRARSIGG